jgi:prophage regulatory protein
MTDIFLRGKDVTRVTGLSRSMRYRLIDLGEFPQPIKISERCVAWSAAEIERWQQERIAERNDKMEVA